MKKYFTSKITDLNKNPRRFTANGSGSFDLLENSSSIKQFFVLVIIMKNSMLYLLSIIFQVGGRVQSKIFKCKLSVKLSRYCIKLSFSFFKTLIQCQMRNSYNCNEIEEYFLIFFASSLINEFSFLLHFQGWINCVTFHYQKLIVAAKCISCNTTLKACLRGFTYTL